MSHYVHPDRGASVRRRTISDIKARKGGEPIVCLTAYTAPVARMADRYADLLLVGDSVGMVLYGFDSTLPVTLEIMEAHGRAVVHSTQRALVVVDMPFGSYQESPQAAFRNAARLMKETGAAAVKIEGGAEMAGTIAFLTARGVPVMGHVGLQPQSVHADGGYRVKGRSDEDHVRICEDARIIQKSGVFAFVLECVTPSLAADISGSSSVPVIGIGASAACDGQILVTEDMLGLSADSVPKFVKQYERLGGRMEAAIAAYAGEVRARHFPAPPHVYDDETGAQGLPISRRRK